MQFWEELSALSLEILAIVRSDFSIGIKSPRWREKFKRVISTGGELSSRDIVHPDDRAEFELYVQSVLAGKSIVPFENRIWVDGSSHWIRWTFSKSERGDYVLASGKDITEEKKSRSYLQQIEEASQIGGWEIDMDTHELRWSPACYRIHEVDPVNYRPKLEDGLSFFPDESATLIKQAVEKLMSTGESYDLKLRFKTAKGRLTWVRVISKVEFKDGRIVRCFGSIQDISDEIEREQESRSYTERFQAIANNIPVMLSLFNEKGDLVWCNPSLAAELGWDLEDISGRNAMADFFPDPEIRQAALEFLLKPEAGWKDFLTRKRDGSSIYTSWATARLSDGYSVGIGRNVDAAYRLNHDLRSTHDKLRLAMEVGGLGTWELFPKTGVVHYSDEWLKMLGLNFEQTESRIEVWQNRIHPEDVKAANFELSRCLFGKADAYRGVHRLCHEDGTWISVQSFGQVVERDEDGNAERFLAVTLDVTQSKVAESLLVEQNTVLVKMKERLELALRAGKFGVWDWNLKTGELVWDSLMYDLFEVDAFHFKNGYPDFQKFLLPEDATRLSDELNYAFRTKAAEFRTEFRILTAQGRVKVIAALASCFYDHHGNIDRLVGNNWDITEQRNSEAALAEAKVEAERFFTMSLDPICVADLGGGLRRVNPAFVKSLGYTEIELQEFNMLDVIHPDDRAASKENLKKLKLGIPIHQFEHRVLAKDGKYRILSWVAKPDIETNTVFGAFRDITEIRENELKLLQSARMATLGEMAGGIAHEVNNPLAIIHGRSRQILRSLEKGVFDKEKLKSDIGKIEIIADRIAKIVRGLRTFSRDSTGDPMAVESVREMVFEVLDLGRERFKNHEVSLEVDVQANVHVLCRSQQFGQVLLNLVNNAHDAVIDLPDKWVRIIVEEVAGYVRVSVVDSGRGIEDAIALRMMNPFFTTKEVGKGTGLGLSISKGIAEEHGGRLYYDKSATNTTFCFELPLATPKIESGDAEKVS